VYCKEAAAASSPYCQGNNTCMCQAYCKQSVAAVNWGYDPNCCLCSGTSAAGGVPVAPVAPAVPVVPFAAPVPAGAPGGTFGGLKHPMYCQTLPIWAPPPAPCLGEKTCGCQSYCLASVEAGNWGFDPNCCACTTSSGVGEPAHAAAGAGAVSAPASPVVAKTPEMPLKHPAYCPSLVASSIYSPWCAGEKTCNCAPYCGSVVAPLSWPNDPQCCGCDGKNSMPPPSPPVGAGAAPAAKGETIGVPLKHPSYCSTLPPGASPVWCSGENSCGCETYCKASVAPQNWGVDPNCCGCALDKAGGQAAPGAPPVVAPPPAPGAGAGTAVYKPLKHPRYCDSVAKGAPTPMWCVGDDTCGCKPYCTASVMPANWGWDPNCCGCSNDISSDTKVTA